TRLREQDQRRCVRRLRREREVEQDERVRIEVDEDRVAVEGDPGDDDDRLREDVPRCAEEAREALGVAAEPVVAERRRQSLVRKEEAERLLHEPERLLDGTLDRLRGHGQNVLGPPASPAGSRARRRGSPDRPRRWSPGTTRGGAAAPAIAARGSPRGVPRRAVT